jgi:hypothetical protein
MQEVLIKSKIRRSITIFPESKREWRDEGGKRGGKNDYGGGFRGGLEC